MAASRLPRPGTKLGPCKRCQHIDCSETRDMAEGVCRICSEPIGYDRRFYRDDIVGDRGPETKAYVHASCLEDSIGAR